MLIRRATLCALLFFLLGCLQLTCSRYVPAKGGAKSHGSGATGEKLSDYKCKEAKDKDRPRGGEFVLAGEGTVGAIVGTALSRDKKADNWGPLGEVVVELYNYSGGANREEVTKAVREQKRVAACLTGDDGKFSLSGLKPGRYLFRAGSLTSDKYDEVHAILTLDPARPLSELKILL